MFNQREKMRVITLVGLCLHLSSCGDNIKPLGPPPIDADYSGPAGPSGPPGPEGPPGECYCFTPETEAVCASGGHALWFSRSLGHDFVFVSGGDLVSQEDGSLRLTGVVARASDSRKAFRIDVTFFELSPVVPNGSPKTPPPCGDYTTWQYYMHIEGTLEGLGQWAGALLVLERRGPAVQVGEGASVHSCNMGLATWFTFYTVVNPCGLPDQGVGDINIDIGTSCL